MSTPSPTLDAEETLAQRKGQARHHALPNLRPKDAATLVIVDRTGSNPRILMGKRHDNHRFMPGVFVFPGGRVELGDSRIASAGELAENVSHALSLRVSRPSARLARAMALAAIRETYEETGIIIGQKHERVGGMKLHKNWEDFFATGYLPSLSPLVYFARAITPPRHIRRFDTRFFAVSAEHIAHQAANTAHENAELTELRWVTLAETATLPLATITRDILKELEAMLTEYGMPHGTDIPFYCERHGKFCREILAPNKP